MYVTMCIMRLEPVNYFLTLIRLSQVMGEKDLFPLLVSKAGRGFQCGTPVPLLAIIFLVFQRSM